MEDRPAQGIACAPPIHGTDGKALRGMGGKPAAIVSFLEVLWPRRIHPFHCAEVGGALARLHAAVAGFTQSRINTLSLAGWEGLYRACAPRADTVAAGLKDELKGELE